MRHRRDVDGGRERFKVRVPAGDGRRRGPRSSVRAAARARGLADRAAACGGDGRREPVYANASTACRSMSEKAQARTNAIGSAGPSPTRRARERIGCSVLPGGQQPPPMARLERLPLDEGRKRELLVQHHQVSRPHRGTPSTLPDRRPFHPASVSSRQTSIHARSRRRERRRGTARGGLEPVGVPIRPDRKQRIAQMQQRQLHVLPFSTVRPHPTYRRPTYLPTLSVGVPRLWRRV